MLSVNATISYEVLLRRKNIYMFVSKNRKKTSICFAVVSCHYIRNILFSAVAYFCCMNFYFRSPSKHNLIKESFP